MNTDIILLAAALITGIVFPGYALYGGRRLQEMLVEHPHLKKGILKMTGIQLCILALVSLVPVIASGHKPDAIGLGFISDPLLMILLFVIPAIAWVLLSRVRISDQRAARIMAQNERIQFLLPTRKDEHNVMMTVSYAAGICEEIVYRGFLFWYLQEFLPFLVALVLATLPFALGHLTSTGIKNTIAAFFLGLIFAGAYWVTSSLWLPIVLHILVDMYSVTMAYKASQVTEEIRPTE